MECQMCIPDPPAPIIPFCDDLLRRGVFRPHPPLEGEPGANAHIQTGGSRDTDEVVHPIQSEPLTHLATGKGRAVLQNTGVRAGLIGRVVFAAPPTDESDGRNDTVCLGKRGNQRQQQQADNWDEATRKGVQWFHTFIRINVRLLQLCLHR